VAQDKVEILRTLSGRHPRHQFGQNFMIDGNLVRTIADAGALTKDDMAIEVGPGTGTLTQELLDRAGEVVAVEIDRDLAASLRERYANEPRFRLIEGDAMDGKHALNAELSSVVARERRPVLVANLPYNIASPLVIELLIAGVERLVFTVQKEVADRLRAAAGSEDYGGLTVMVQLLSKVEYLRTIGPGAFWPPPSIDSALVRLTRCDQLQGTSAKQFGEFVAKMFSFRRKTIGKALSMAGYDCVNVPAEIDLKVRIETLPPALILKLFLGLTGNIARGEQHGE